MKKFFVYFFMAFAIVFSPQAVAQEPIPGIASLSESSGTTEGGNVVSATGVNFSEQTVVTVNGSEATVEFVDSSTINITMPSSDEGEARIFVTNDGLVSTESMGRYEYIAPEPEIVPEPEPSPEPTPEPEPISQPAPQPISQPAPQPISQPAPQESSPLVTQTVSDPVVYEEAVEETVEEYNDNTTYLSDNAYIIYQDNTENVVVSTDYNVPQKFVLRQRVEGEWIYVDKSYQFDGNVVFLDTNLELGYTYKVIVEINGKKTIAAWFDVLTKQYTVV